VGFGRQLIKALAVPPPGSAAEALEPGSRVMYSASAEPFQPLRERMEREWTPAMMATLGLEGEALPII